MSDDDTYGNPRCPECGGPTYYVDAELKNSHCHDCDKVWRITQDQQGDTLHVRFKEVKSDHDRTRR